MTPNLEACHAFRRVAVFGPYVSRNLGDTATQIAVIQNLQERRPSLKILGVSPDPEDTLCSLGIPTFPLTGLGPIAGDLLPFKDFSAISGSTAKGRPYSPMVIIRIARFVRTLDMLIVSGGGQLDDFWGGPWGHPWSMLLWTALARAMGVPVVYLGVGLDVLKTRLSQRFSLMALRMASQRLFRDIGSLDSLRALGLNHDSSVCPDLAFSLTEDMLTTVDAPDSTKRFAIISPISRKTWSHQGTDIHAHYMRALSEVSLELAARGLSLRIVCSQSSMDLDDAELLATQLRNAGVSEIQVHHAPRVTDFIHLVRGAEIVVASRLHGVILSLGAGCPVLALAHLAKVEAVMHDIGLDAYCLPLQRASSARLCALAGQILEQGPALREHISKEVTGFRTRLATTFDEIAMLSDASNIRRGPL